LGEKVDFNDAYRLGFDRVGCWCCPNNTERAQLLAKVYMPDEWNRWRNYLVSFAKSIGKPDPEEYIDGGWWKARQGGNGVAAADDILIKQTNCTTEENAKIYNLNKPLSDDFFTLLVPFGKVSKELGRKLIGEILVLDVKTNTPIISVQPHNQQGYDYPVKIKTMNIANHSDLQRMISYQVKKHNACRKCLKCESVCSSNAITVTGESYVINADKCTHCKKCVTAKYLEGGCLMEKFLRTVRGKAE
jgi:phosphoadenosine phosphosulfate reductase